MGFFHQPKPRHFHHEPIYYNEHRDRVRQIEKQAREELVSEGKLPSDKSSNDFDASKIRGAFTGLVGRRKQQRSRLLSNNVLANTGAIIVIILVLIIVWIYLQR